METKKQTISTDKNYIFENGRYICTECLKKNIHTSFAVASSICRHRNTEHRGVVDKQKISTSLKQATKVALIHKTTETITLADVCKEIKELKQSIKPSQQTTINNQNIYNTTINIYFNKDFKYYPLLVEKLGKDKAHHYLLTELMESKDLYGPLNYIFAEGGCPLEIEDGILLIHRNEATVEKDVTGKIFDREHRNNLVNATLFANTIITEDINKFNRLKLAMSEDAEELPYRICDYMDGTVSLKRLNETIDFYKNGNKCITIPKLAKLCPVIKIKTKNEKSM
jgi:hypothetical protein